MYKSEKIKQRFKILIIIAFPSMVLILSMGMTSMNTVTLVPAIPQTSPPTTITITVTETMTDYTREPDTTETSTEYHTTTINNPSFGVLSTGGIYILTGTLALGGGMLLAWGYERVRKIK